MVIAGLIVSVTGLIVVIQRMGNVARGIAPPTLVVPDPAAEGLHVPPFRLVDHTGQEVTEQLFDGRVTVLNFIFTHCPFACPMMMVAMSEAAARLADTPVRFVSVSVDPVRDTPARLRQYAADNDVDLSRWTFLTGDEQEVRRILLEGLALGLQTDHEHPIPLPDGTSMPNIIHPTKLIVVGPDRRVLGMYPSENAEGVTALVRKARAALRTLPRER